MVSYLDRIEGFSSICLTASKYHQRCTYNECLRTIEIRVSLGTVWDSFGLLFGSSGALLRSLLASLGPFLHPLGLFWISLGTVWDFLGLLFGPPGAFFGSLVGISWALLAPLGPPLSYLGLALGPRRRQDSNKVLQAKPKMRLRSQKHAKTDSRKITFSYLFQYFSCIFITFHYSINFFWRCK